MITTQDLTDLGFKFSKEFRNFDNKRVLEYKLILADLVITVQNECNDETQSIVQRVLININHYCELKSVKTIEDLKKIIEIFK